MKRIGIIGAMEEEVSNLKEEMTDVTTKTKAGMEFFEGKLCGVGAVVVRSGIGKVNAGICTQILVDDYGIGAVINTGIAGSLLSEINIGDIVVSVDALQYDVHVEAFDYAPGQIPRMDTLAFPADKMLIALAEAVCKEVNPDIRTHRGRIVSGDSFVSDHETKMKLREMYNGSCAEMEGAAIAQAAYLNGIGCVILRAISDKADDSAAEDYDTFEKKAIRHSVNLVRGMLQKIGEKA
jgi:adenosylhomocysteine nucleosidase